MRTESRALDLSMGPMALVGGKHFHIIQRDMTSDLKRHVLLRLTEALQDEDVNALRDLELYRGWGNVIYVRIHTGISPSFEHRNRLRSLFEAAVSSALSPNRHSVEIRWSR
jgi:NOL1/NOP2/fmu family ribosome biogenesis protein